MNERDLQNAIAEAYEAAFPEDDRRLVYGEGVWTQPPLLLIGEAPGAQEAEQGRPFVGKAGQNLNAFLQVVGLERTEIRITNVVKVRPYKVSAKGTLSNRPPNRAELTFFTPWLHEEIRLTAPRMLVTLGNTALQAVLHGMVIGACHGEVQEVLLDGKAYQLFPLYHPASIIYNRSLTAVYQQDLEKLAVVLRDT